MKRAARDLDSQLCVCFSFVHPSSCCFVCVVYYSHPRNLRGFFPCLRADLICKYVRWMRPSIKGNNKSLALYIAVSFLYVRRMWTSAQDASTRSEAFIVFGRDCDHVYDTFMRVTVQVSVSFYVFVGRCRMIVRLGLTFTRGLSKAL